MVQSGTATDARPHLGSEGLRFHTQDSASPPHGLKTIRATEIVILHSESAATTSILKQDQMNNQKQNRRPTSQSQAFVIGIRLESIARPTNILFSRTRTSKIGGVA